MTRRVLFARAGVAVVAAGAVAWEIDDLVQPPGQRRAVRSFPLRDPVLQIVAHPDDDLYFMNPFAWQDVAGGGPIVTAYLAAGESDGRNISIRAQDRGGTPVDYPGYVEARRNGIRTAYALMAVGRADSPWRVTSVRLGPALLVEQSVLEARPDVTLYFAGLRRGSDAKDGPVEGSSQRLDTLWTGVARHEPTIAATGSPQRAVQEVGKDELIDALVALMRKHRPRLVRAMDPDPDHTLSVVDSIHPSDHIDHTAAAEFAVAALGRYVAAGAVPPVVEHFRGYANQYWPANLPQSVYKQKVDLIAKYGGGGRPDCYLALCGDLQLGEDTDIHYGYSTWPRYPAPTGWIRAQPDGSLTAVAALGGRAVTWRRGVAPDAPWAGPAQLAPQGYIAPTLSVVEGPGGLLYLLALRRTAALDATPIVEVVWCAQEKAGGAFGGWQSLGSVEADDPVRSRETGIPVGAFDSAGVFSVFVRDFYQGVSCVQRSKTGTWGDWQQVLPPGPYQDGLAVLARRAGTVEVYAASAAGVARLWQRRPGAPFELDSTMGTSPPASPPTVFEDGTGRVALLFRTVRSTDFAVCAGKGEPGEWKSTTVHGPGGIGPVSGLAWHTSNAGGSGSGSGGGGESGGGSGIVLAATAADGSPSIASVASVDALLDSSTPIWHEPDGRLLGGGAAVVQAADGTLVIGCLGRDGRLWTTSQAPAKLGAGFPPWTRVG